VLPLDVLSCRGNVDVQRQGLCVEAFVTEGSGCRVGPFLIPAGEDDAVASLGQRAGGSETQPAAGTGHKCDRHISPISR